MAAAQLTALASPHALQPSLTLQPVLPASPSLQGEEIGSGKGNSHSLWVLSRRLVRMLLKQSGPIALTAAAAVLVGPGGVSDPSKHRSQTQVGGMLRLMDGRLSAPAGVWMVCRGLDQCGRWMWAESADGQVLVHA